MLLLGVLDIRTVCICLCFSLSWVSESCAEFRPINIALLHLYTVNLYTVFSERSAKQKYASHVAAMRSHNAMLKICFWSNASMQENIYRMLFRLRNGVKNSTFACSPFAY